MIDRVVGATNAIKAKAGTLHRKMRKNPLLEGFPIDKQDIRDDFQSVVQKHSLDFFLKKCWLEKGGENIDTAPRDIITKRYKEYLSAQLLGPFGEIMRHYMEITLSTECSEEDIIAHEALMMIMLWFQESLITNHLIHLYPQEKQIRNSPGVIKKTAGRIRKSLIREKK